MKDFKTIAVIATIDQLDCYSFWQEVVVDIQTQKINNWVLVDLTGKNILHSALNLPAASFVHPIKTIAPEVKTQNCKFCAACMKKCDFDVIAFHKKEKTASVHPENCIDCGKCYQNCKQKNAIKRTEYTLGLVEGIEMAPHVSVFNLTSDSKKTLRKLGLPVVLNQIADKSILLMAIDTQYAGNKIVAQANVVFDPSKDGGAKEFLELILHASGDAR